MNFECHRCSLKCKNKAGLTIHIKSCLVKNKRITNNIIKKNTPKKKIPKKLSKNQKALKKK